MDAIIEVAEEQSQGFSRELESSTGSDQERSLPMVTTAMVQDVCQTLLKYVLLPQMVREALEILNYVDLQHALRFQDGCLVQGRFVNAAMEKAWTKYHAAFLNHRSQVTEVTHSPAAAAWISLKVFERLLSDAYSKNKDNIEAAVVDISEKERAQLGTLLVQ
ncbi:uncharacterized protein [Littorina saxatilis]|uniref:uncharacterized protein n=1 Tax=Littorina saxatilis TaxID=31220 RepID=UPI0038B5AFE2